MLFRSETEAFSPFKVMCPAYTGLCREDFGVVLSQHAIVARPSFHVDLFLPHHTRLALKGRGRKQNRVKRQVSTTTTTANPYWTSSLVLPTVSMSTNPRFRTYFHTELSSVRLGSEWQCYLKRLSFSTWL